MSTLAARPRTMIPGRLPQSAAMAGLWGLSLLASAGATLYLGVWAVMVPVYIGGFILSVIRPALAAYLVLVLAIVLEPGTVDWTGPVSDAFWQMPPKFENLVGFTTSPLELFTLVAAASAFVTLPSRVKLPPVAWAVPAVMFLGLAYGWYKGAELNLAYNEARGLIVGVGVFVLATRVLPENHAKLIRPVMFAVTLLAASILLRYVVYVRGGRLSVPTEFAFTHEASVILGVGFVTGVVSFFRGGASRKERLISVVFCVLVVAAMVASGRRAATLVLLVGGGTLGLLMLPKRPVMVLALSVPILLVTTAYLGAYWNKEYGAMAQPARAIRSQIDPNSRDESSDDYRTIEKYDVMQTIRWNQTFGVGFGRPFAQPQPLPDLQSFWPLQHYTPHQNVLWIWLKMGIAGMAVIFGFAAVAVARCFQVARTTSSESEWAVAVVSLSVIVMFLMYSTVDLGFIGARSVAPAAVACAIAFSLGQVRRNDP